MPKNRRTCFIFAFIIDDGENVAHAVPVAMHFRGRIENSQKKKLCGVDQGVFEVCQQLPVVNI